METPRPRVNAGVRPHVLVVSAEQELSSFLAEGLTAGDLWTSTVASPFQALEVFRLRTFDAVLVDAALGGFGWEELTRRLRGPADPGSVTSTRADVPLFVVAASDTEASPVEATAAGADGLFLAPVEIDAVATTLLAAILAWRDAHPDRPWADQPALDRPRTSRTNQR